MKAEYRSVSNVHSVRSDVHIFHCHLRLVLGFKPSGRSSQEEWEVHTIHYSSCFSDFDTSCGRM